MKVRAVLGLLVCLAVMTGIGIAGDQDFRLVNATGLEITELYVSSTKSDNWEEDVLGVDVLEDGEACNISFSRAENACHWDLRIVDADGDEVVWNRLDLCSITQVTLYWENGKAWAEVD